jgi:hypothetical protein
MRLSEYLESNNLSCTRLAADIGISFHQIYNLTRGGRPSVFLSCKIESYTGGKVTAWDYLTPDEQKQAKSYKNGKH